MIDKIWSTVERHLNAFFIGWAALMGMMGLILALAAVALVKVIF